MKTTFDIEDILFKIVNVVSVQATIDGRVYRNKKPLNSELRDIVIVPLVNYKGDEIVNDATYFVNCYCKNLANGTFDITKLRAMTDAVAAVIEAYNNTSNYCVFDIVNQTAMNDDDQKTMAYASLRLKCYIEE